MKEFNTVGICQPDKHYMCDVMAKFNRCRGLIERGKYFAINFPRQHGKTSMQCLLRKSFDSEGGYLVISTSFEGIGDLPFESEERLAPMIPRVLSKGVRFRNPELGSWLDEQSVGIHNFEELSVFITEWVRSSSRKVVVLFDEIDKASNNQVFMSFLAMLRDKYLATNEGMDATFHSVALIGVHDVKTLKLKLRPDEGHKLNSPWNIAVDLGVEFTFNAAEIEPMLADYAEEHDLEIDSPSLALRLFYYTSGNPFLVSKMCQVVDERLMNEYRRPWTLGDIDDAYRDLVDVSHSTTNFSDMYKNLENNSELSRLVRAVVIDGED